MTQKTLFSADDKEAIQTPTCIHRLDSICNNNALKLYCYHISSEILAPEKDRSTKAIRFAAEKKDRNNDIIIIQ